MHKIGQWFPIIVLISIAALMITGGLLDLGLAAWLALPLGIIGGGLSAIALLVASLTITRDRRRILASLPRCHALCTPSHTSNSANTRASTPRLPARHPAGAAAWRAVANSHSGATRK